MRSCAVSPPKASRSSLISSEIPELILNAERVLVLRGGRLTGELTGTTINEEAILAAAMTS